MNSSSPEWSREIAQALGVSLGAVGHLESVYALGVAVGAPGVRGRRDPLRPPDDAAHHHHSVPGRNLISALSPGYGAIMAGRVVSATAHGAFLGIAAVFAADLVDPARKGRAVALVFSGLTASTVLGAPLGAAVGQALGWRFTFWTLVIFGGVALLGLPASLPRTAAPAARQHHATGPAHQTHRQSPGHEHGPGHGPADAEFEGLDPHALAHLGGGGHGPTLREQVAALARPAVWAALVTTLLGYGGVFTSYVYIVPQLTQVGGFDRVWITPLLLLFGAGLFVGNHLGGKLADRRLMPAILGTLGALAVALVAMGPALHSQPAAVLMMFLFGVAAFAVVAPLQLRVMSAAGHAPDVASAANISAFTLAARSASTWAEQPSTAGWAWPRSTGSARCSPPAAWPWPRSAPCSPGDHTPKRPPPAATNTPISTRCPRVITTDLRDNRVGCLRLHSPGPPLAVRACS
jgi:MFS transporter, DHA1 family, inner membrane transport protein